MKQKVLQVLGGIGFGGAEAFVMNQFRNLKNDYVFDFAVQVHIDDNASYENEIKQLGGSVFYTDVFRKSPIEYMRQIRRIIKEHGPYVAVHIHVNEQCGFAALGAYKAFQGKIIVHAHSSRYDQKNEVVRHMMLACNKFLVKMCADNIVACSLEAAHTYFGRIGENAVILKNPIDLRRFAFAGEKSECRQMLGVTTDGLVILHIGRFVEVKNHAFILELCHQLYNKGVDYIMLLVGDGELRMLYETEAKKLACKDRIIFLGERSDIPIVLKAADLMILPSKYEGLPTVVLEAQASGVKCVISDKVSEDCDIGVGLVKRLPIEEKTAIDIWIETILDTKAVPVDNQEIVDAFVQKGIDLDETSRRLSNLYR